MSCQLKVDGARRIETDSGVFGMHRRFHEIEVDFGRRYRAPPGV